MTVCVLHLTDCPTSTKHCVFEKEVLVVLRRNLTFRAFEPFLNFFFLIEKGFKKKRVEKRDREKFI